MKKAFELKETPFFDDEELNTSFKEWHQRISEERITLQEILQDKTADSVSEYKRFYQRIGIVSNDMFNDFTNVINEG